VAAAQDAQLKIDGISVTQSTNAVKDAIDGVTLNLTQTNVGQPLTLGVSRDTKTITDAVQSFVTAYNGASGVLKSYTAFNGAGAQNGVLLGDGTARSIQSQMRNLLNTAVDSGGALTTLSQIGVSFGSDGTLSLDATKLSIGIADDFDGIAALFAKAGKATDSLVSYSASTSNTIAGTYAVAVSQVATRGATQGSQAAALTVTAGVDDQLDLTVDGVAASAAPPAPRAARRQRNPARLVQLTPRSVLVTQSGGAEHHLGTLRQRSQAVTAATAWPPCSAHPCHTAGVDVAAPSTAPPPVAPDPDRASGDASEGLAPHLVHSVRAVHFIQ
jgi:flagellar hook-associated protein 2